MTSQSDAVVAGELVGTIWYVAPAGHRYIPGQTFSEIADQPDLANFPSANAAYWVAVAPGGARKVLGRSHAQHTRDAAGHANDLLEDHPGAEIYHVRHNFIDHPLDVDTWMDYDWAVSLEPVNQWTYLPEWRAHVGRFAHGFDSLPGFESFNQLSASQKATAFRVGQTIGGHAFERLGFWLTYDASLSDDWKLPIVMDPVKKAVDAVCFECQSETAARRLALTIDATAFAAKLAAGHIHGTDRSVNPWTPGDLLTVVTATSEETTLETAISRLVYSFNSARDYYDTHVAHEVVDHDH